MILYTNVGKKVYKSAWYYVKSSFNLNQITGCLTFGGGYLHQVLAITGNEHFTSPLRSFGTQFHVKMF